VIQHAVRSLRSESEGELVGIEYGLLRIGLLVRVPYCEVREKESKLGGSTRDEEYEHFFREARPRLVGQAYLLCGSLQEAQDLAQEVLLRAWQNWSRVRDLDDAQAWARHVLHNLAISNWRRQRLRLRRHGLALPSSSPDPGVGHLDVASAISALPVNQRRALVLQAVVGMSTTDIAAELGASEGTVRVWLVRARAGVAEQLGRDRVPLPAKGDSSGTSR
jgi:RNA polymerase sigma-70 factor (sigma-E family)